MALEVMGSNPTTHPIKNPECESIQDFLHFTSSLFTLFCGIIITKAVNVMITGPVTNEELLKWQEIHKRFKDKLSPNRKSGSEVLDYIKSKYPLDETFEERFLLAVSENVLANEFLREKLPEGVKPDPMGFFLRNEGAGSVIYAGQEEVWEACPIFVGIDLNSGYVHVEGSSMLYDEIFAFQGIDKFDIENYVITAAYLDCLKKHNFDYYQSLVSK